VDEEDVSAEPPAPEENTWLPGADEDPWRPESAQAPPCQGPKAPHGLVHAWFGGMPPPIRPLEARGYAPPPFSSCSEKGVGVSTGAISLRSGGHATRVRVGSGSR